MGGLSLASDGDGVPAAAAQGRSAPGLSTGTARASVALVADRPIVRHPADAWGQFSGAETTVAFSNPFKAERWLEMSWGGRIGFGASVAATALLSVLCIFEGATARAAPDYWLYLGALIGAAVACLTAALRLRLAAAAPAADPAARDLGDARRIGATFLVLVAPMPLLVANSLLGRQPGPDAVGVFDVLTWLGTLATLAVVVSGAWVAVYVKRRDDERQHRLSVMTMRQVWIDSLRGDLADLISAALTLHRAALDEILDPDAAHVALKLQEKVALRLNPVEPHHHMLNLALRGLLRAGGVNDHLRKRLPETPIVDVVTYEAASAWTTSLAQLVLKIEWVVTSLGSDRIEEKVGRQWSALLAYEASHRGEILTVVSRFIALRARYPHLTGNPDADPGEGAA